MDLALEQLLLMRAKEGSNLHKELLRRIRSIGRPLSKIRKLQPRVAKRCRALLFERVREIGLEIRAGLHTGEVERRGSAISGLAVHIGARVAALAEASEVLVTDTVKALVIGSGIAFRDRGTHHLKGVPDDWHLFGVEAS